jgi:hypothetical protein
MEVTKELTDTFNASKILVEEYGEHYFNTVDLVSTRDTIQNFKDNLVSFSGVDTSGNMTVFRDAQYQKGDERQDIFVLDFGAWRIVNK